MLRFATWLHVRCPACVPCPASWCSEWVPECRQAGSKAWARLSRTKVQVRASEQHATQGCSCQSFNDFQISTSLPPIIYPLSPSLCFSAASQMNGPKQKRKSARLQPVSQLTRHPFEIKTTNKVLEEQ
ncbi:hypothetical protein CHARACLAT_007054 [Characodon lateralis]|uniref:Secreted protein n=1 Tax=Characodon lateralis TaxID=208331 RepID=A0ABU7E1L8_9TELE|nr:hypothetical protein [Characodon lateralis]